MLDPRRRFDIVKDPIHGYIRFTRERLSKEEKATEADLINSPWLQRLRHIHQLQTAWYVYPAADHARFVHALGTMELAGRFARAVYEPFHRFLRGRLNGEPLPEVEHVVETFRVAGLLHDVGHGPMTHLLDREYLVPRFGITHEDITGRIIRDELKDLIRGLRRTPDGSFEQPLDVDIICDLIKKGAEKNLTGIWRPLHQIMRGAYDADKMDFLLRDSLLCGERKMVGGDVERLMLTSFLSNDGTRLQLHYSSLPLLLTFIKFRQHMLEVVYYHRTVRAFELMVRETLPTVVECLIPEDPRENLPAYLRFDECSFFSCVREHTCSDRHIEAVWNGIWRRELCWKQADEHKKELNNPQDVKPTLTADELSSRLKSGTGLVPGEHYLVDAPSVETPGNVFSFGPGARDSLAIYFSEKRVETKTVDQLAQAGLLPVKLLQYRLYARKDLPDDKVRELRGVFRDNLGLTPGLDSELESSF